MIVMKFGGSSVENASAIQRVAGIVKSHAAHQPVVVVSAIGKTTNRLLHIAEFAANGDGIASWRKLLALQADHLQIASKLRLAIDAPIEDLFHELRGDVLQIASAGQVSAAMWDRVAGFGERLSSLIVAAALQQAGIPSKHLDARQLIVTTDRHTAAEPLTIETYAKVRRAIPCANRSQIAVLGGFIGATENGTPTTLGRGGSDYTAALIGAAISADEIQIWTDVDGMLTCDPRVMPGALCLNAITYDEAERMARLGAKVLHPETILPARKQRVPVSIRNSRNPSHAGTTITDSGPCTQGVKSIAIQTNAIRTNATHASAMQSGAMQSNFGIVSLVGNAVDTQSARAQQALRRAGLEAHVADESRLSLSFEVPAAKLPAAVSALHQEFFAERFHLAGAA